MAKIPLVSVIISMYKSEIFIKECLENIIQQSIFNECEVIIIDSASPENEAKIVTHYAQQYPQIRYYRTDNRETIYCAWNRAIKMAKGKFIANLNTDDRFHTHALDIMSTTLQKDEQVALVYIDQIITSTPNQRTFSRYSLNRFSRPAYDRLLLLSNYFLGSQLMWKKEVHDVDGIYFNEQFEVAGDYDFACQIAERYEIRGIQQFLGLYFKSDAASNKEYQNQQVTLSETVKIRESYLPRFINTIGPEELKKLQRYIKVIKRISPYVYVCISRLNDFIRRRKPLYPYTFLCWCGALLEEKAQNYTAAEEFYQRASRIPSGAYLKKYMKTPTA